MLGRILEVSPRGLPWRGGVEVHVQKLAEEIQGRGVPVTVFTHWSNDEVGLTTPLSGSVNGVLYRRFPLPFRGRWEIPSWRLLRELRRSSRMASVVHIHHYHQPLGLFAVLALRGVSTPIVVTPHYHGTGHTPFRSLLHKVWRPTLGRLFLSQADRVVAVSAPEAELIVDHFPSLRGRVDVVPNGIVPPPLNVPMKGFEGRRVLLSVGRLEPYKRHDRVIEALRHLPEEVVFVLVGSGPDEGRLRRLAGTLGVDERVVFAGAVADSELASWWARADVFVSLSEQEAFGLVLGEAIAAGVPAVVSDIPAFRYVAGLAETEGAPRDAVTFTDGARCREVLSSALPRYQGVVASRWEMAADNVLDLISLLTDERNSLNGCVAEPEGTSSD